MKAVILAGGKGTRVRPITETIPKPMIPIINKPILEFLIELLRQHGFNQIMITTSYLAWDIESYFREGSRFGVHIGYSYEGYYKDGAPVPEGIGSAGGLKKIQEASGFFDETFVVLCGDAIIDLDLTRALEMHRRAKALATIVLKEVPKKDLSRFGIVETAPDGRILQFQEKPSPDRAVSTLANTGIYVFEPEVLDLIPSNRTFDIGGELFPLLAERKLPFFGFAIPFSWIDIGCTSAYWQATQMIMRGEFKIDMPGREVRPNVWGGINLDIDFRSIDIQGPVYIGSSTRIEPGAMIHGPTVVGRNCLVETGARIDACIVGDYTRVSSFADLHEKIVSGRFCVDSNGTQVDLAGGGYTFVIDDTRERRAWTADQQVLIDFLRSPEVRDDPKECDTLTSE
jgi:mannose-1-phosphate guanylyltransferase